MNIKASIAYTALFRCSSTENNVVDYIFVFVISSLINLDSSLSFRNECNISQKNTEKRYTLPVTFETRRLVEGGAVPLTNFVDGFDEDGIMIDKG